MNPETMEKLQKNTAELSSRLSNLSGRLAGLNLPGLSMGLIASGTVPVLNSSTDGLVQNGKRASTALDNVNRGIKTTQDAHANNEATQREKFNKFNSPTPPPKLPNAPTPTPPNAPAPAPAPANKATSVTPPPGTATAAPTAVPTRPGTPPPGTNTTPIKTPGTTPGNAAAPTRATAAPRPATSSSISNKLNPSSPPGGAAAAKAPVPTPPPSSLKNPNTPTTTPGTAKTTPVPTPPPINPKNPNTPTTTPGTAKTTPVPTPPPNSNKGTPGAQVSGAPGNTNSPAGRPSTPGNANSPAGRPSTPGNANSPAGRPSTPGNANSPAGRPSTSGIGAANIGTPGTSASRDAKTTPNQGSTAPRNTPAAQPATTAPTGKPPVTPPGQMTPGQGAQPPANRTTTSPAKPSDLAKSAPGNGVPSTTPASKAAPPAGVSAAAPTTPRPPSTPDSTRPSTTPTGVPHLPNPGLTPAKTSAKPKSTAAKPTSSDVSTTEVLATIRLDDNSNALTDAQTQELDDVAARVINKALLDRRAGRPKLTVEMKVHGADDARPDSHYTAATTAFTTQLTKHFNEQQHNVAPDRRPPLAAVITQSVTTSPTVTPGELVIELTTMRPATSPSLITPTSTKHVTNPKPIPPRAKAPNSSNIGSPDPADMDIDESVDMDTTSDGNVTAEDEVLLAVVQYEGDDPTRLTSYQMEDVIEAARQAAQNALLLSQAKQPKPNLKIVFHTDDGSMPNDDTLNKNYQLVESAAKIQLDELQEDLPEENRVRLDAALNVVMELGPAGPPGFDLQLDPNIDRSHLTSVQFENSNAVTDEQLQNLHEALDAVATQVAKKALLDSRVSLTKPRLVISFRFEDGSERLVRSILTKFVDQIESRLDDLQRNIPPDFRAQRDAVLNVDWNEGPAGTPGFDMHLSTEKPPARRVFAHPQREAEVWNNLLPEKSLTFDHGSATLTDTHKARLDSLAAQVVEAADKRHKLGNRGRAAGQAFDKVRPAAPKPPAINLYGLDAAAGNAREHLENAIAFHADGKNLPATARPTVHAAGNPELGNNVNIDVNWDTTSTPNFIDPFSTPPTETTSEPWTGPKARLVPTPDPAPQHYVGNDPAIKAAIKAEFEQTAESERVLKQYGPPLHSDDDKILNDESWRHASSDPTHPSYKEAPWFKPAEIPIDVKKLQHLRAQTPTTTIIAEDRQLTQYTDITPGIDVPPHPEIDIYGSDAWFDRQVLTDDSGAKVEILTVKHYMPKPDFMSLDYLEALKHKAQHAVDEYFNKGYRFPNGNQIHVELEFVDHPSKTHQPPSTSTQPTPLDPDTADKFRPNASNVRVSESPVVFAHELAGHPLGLFDEYTEKGPDRPVFLQHPPLTTPQNATAARPGGVAQSSTQASWPGGVRDQGSGLTARNAWQIANLIRSQSVPYSRHPEIAQDRLFWQAIRDLAATPTTKDPGATARSDNSSNSGHH